MDKYNLLDCTLRDGGYITDWAFEPAEIRGIIEKLTDAGLDFIECGYVGRYDRNENSTRFSDIAQIRPFIPQGADKRRFLAMLDVAQASPNDIGDNDGSSVAGLRVVFYKHQVDEALELCRAVKDKGYALMVQPMVTIDYSLKEYAALSRRIARLDPSAVSIVDSFGYMMPPDFHRFFDVLDNILPPQTMIGYHSHNNMQLSFITAQDILACETNRRLIIDASLYGMGRGAGNLNTELIVNYYNMKYGEKYALAPIMSAISEYIMPISQNRAWGYSPYLFLTGLYKCHPNYACYLLEEHRVTVSEFERFLRHIPEEMKTKCRKPYVLERYEQTKETTASK